MMKILISKLETLNNFQFLNSEFQTLGFRHSSLGFGSDEGATRG